MEREGAGRQQQLWHSGAMAGGEEFTGVCKSDDLVNDFQQEKHKKEETNANTPKRLIPEMRSRDGQLAQRGGDQFPAWFGEG